MADDVTMAYSGTTTTNMTGDNDAALVGLDATKWSVVGSKGKASNFPGLNKDGSIRMYYNASGSNTITVESLEGATINTISMTFTGSNYSNVTVTANGSAVTPNDGVYTINSSSFVLGNGNTSNYQVQIKQITINYSESSDTRTATVIEFADGYETKATKGKDASIALPAATVKAGGYFLLRKLIKQEKLSEKYDYIIIDNNGYLGSMVQNSILASTDLLIPASASSFDFQGIFELINFVTDIINDDNLNMNEINLNGVLITDDESRTQVSKEIKEQFNSTFENIYFYQNTIPHSQDIRKSQFKGKVLCGMRDKSAAKDAYYNFVKEWIEHENN